MDNDFRQNAEKYHKRHRQKRIWHRIVSILGCFVVFCTTYALILPAITQERETFCGKEAHVHDENCYSVQSQHIHDETCYEYRRGELICQMDVNEWKEEHIHKDSCYGDSDLVCTLEENHIHDDSCYSEPELICACTATDSNVHGEECYSERILICELEENHVHGESCYDRDLLCTLNMEVGRESGHVHDDSCYEQVQVLVCELTEGVGGSVLICEESEIPLHTHTEDGYGIMEPVQELTCELEEHTHELICYSDPSADVETERVWERTFEDVELTGIWADDVLAIAKTQLGYHESTKNYAVDESGETKGYTRYGEWYGDQYGDWCAMFVSFCLHYAKVDGVELDSNCQNWIETLSDEAVNLYRQTGTYDCRPGDLIFFDFDGDGISEHVGLVAKTSVDEEGDVRIATESNSDIATNSNASGIKTIEGNTANKVRYVTYALDDPVILGFGELPENPIAYELPKHVHITTCYDETGNIVCGFEAVTDLSEEDYLRVAQAIQMIEMLPTADDIDARILEFEDAEDYEGEERWLTETYQEVARTYNLYAQLSVELQEYVWNRDKLLEMEYIWSAVPLVDTVIGNTIEYSSDMFTADALFVLYAQSGNKYYAFDGNGKAIPINIDSGGVITADVTDKNELLWSFAQKGTDTYEIKNVSTNRYMHAFYHSSTDNNVTTGGAYSSVLIRTDNGIRVRSNSEYAYLDASGGTYRATRDVNAAAEYKFGVVYEMTIWLDGTNGGLMSLAGSPNKGYSVENGQTFTLPETWESPTKYEYKLRGWYDVVNSEYYAPGSEIVIEGSTVFYADWEAATYDVGQFNASVADTVSTNSFITTHVFDYSTMFNMYSQNASATVNAAGHSEQWSLVENGAVDYSGGTSLNFIFSDYDTYGEDITYPENLNAANKNGDVYPGLYTSELAEILFGTENSYDPETGEGVLGKQHIGQADHLFQYGSNPDNEYYGYYYYDSRLNAASYNQSAERFYVYDYLERTADSQKDGGGGEHSDFLPFNSPYANTNGKTVNTYTYSGENGEYEGVTHYMYDAKYNTNNNSVNNVGTNYWFGMSSDIEFYLPNQPGTTDSEGNNGNQSIYGDDMIFEFSGDDDVWILVDGEIVLDIGGIHGIESGSINFSTGQVEINGTVDGTATAKVKALEPGEHTLTFYYLERGSSQSNCKIRFNLSPRYMLTLQKEDVLTRELLNGAEFTVYTDLACTVPAKLWASREDYTNDQPSTNVFTIEDGQATIWGFAAGNTYYIKETRPPSDYGENVLVNGIIMMTLNNKGDSSYNVIEEPNTGALSGGFTVHGIKVDYENQEAFLVVTNGKDITEVTSVSVQKKWNDDQDHSSTPITVYMLADGKRIREVTLNSDNGWSYTWGNLPKFGEDGVTEIVYTVQEGTIPGYAGKIEQITEGTSTTTTWTEVSGFVDDGAYVLKTDNGYLAAGNNGFYWLVDEATAKASAQARWQTAVSGNQVSFTNEAGQMIFYYNYSSFRASSNPGSEASFTFEENKIKYNGAAFGALQSDGSAAISWWDGDNPSIFTPYKETVNTSNIPAEGTVYLITNSPVAEDETVSLSVTKAWDLGTLGTRYMYEGLTVEVKLLENGIDTGLTTELNLKNDWTSSFTWLPKYDKAGNEIVYTVEEIPIDGPWSAEYGEITLVEGTENMYETTITNVCNLVYILPETGGTGVWTYITGIVLIAVTSASLLLYKKVSCDREEGRTSR